MQRGLRRQLPKRQCRGLLLIALHAWPSFGLQPIGLVRYFPELKAEVAYTGLSGLYIRPIYLEFSDPNFLVSFTHEILDLRCATKTTTLHAALYIQILYCYL
jgi:hypothetical protein